MGIDERGLGELIVESQDLQSDAMRPAKQALPDMADHHGVRLIRFCRRLRTRDGITDPRLVKSSMSARGADLGIGKVVINDL